MNIRILLPLIALLAFATFVGAQDGVEVSPSSQKLADLMRAGKVTEVVALLEAKSELAKLPVLIDDWKPLHLAAALGQVEVVRYLLQHGADANAPMHMQTPLQLAALQGSTEVIDLLIASGAKLDDIDAPKMFDSHEYFSPLATAAAYGRLEAVRRLLDKGAPVESGNPTPLYVAAAGGYTEIFNLLLERGADPARLFEGRSALHAAATGGYIDLATKLLDAKVPVVLNNNDPSPLLAALSMDATLPPIPQTRRFLNKEFYNHGSFWYVSILWSEKYTVSNLKLPPIKPVPATARVDRNATIALLIERGTPLTLVTKYYKETILYYAAEFGDADLVNRCIKAGISPNKSPSWGITPLAIAARYGRVNCLQALLDAGVNVNSQGIPTEYGFPEGAATGTALLYAVDAGEIEAVDALLARGADVNAADFLGRTPLFVAVLHLTPLAKEIEQDAGRRARWIAIAQKLLAKKANPSCSAPPILQLMETTPPPMSLADLVRKSKVPELIKVIAPGDPDPNSIDDDGMTLLATAVSDNNLEDAAYLLKHGANPDLRGKGKMSPIFYAKSLEMVKLLEEGGANIAARTPGRDTALNNWCVKEADLPILKYVVEKHLIDSNAKGAVMKPLFLAVKAKNFAAISLLLDNGADAYITSYDGTNTWSPIEVVVTNRDIELLKFMLDHGVKVDSPYNARSPLGLAVDREAVDIVRLLLDRGADVNVVTGIGSRDNSLAHIILKDGLHEFGKETHFRAILDNPDDPKLAEKLNWPQSEVDGWRTQFRENGYYDPPAERAARRQKILTMLLDAKINLNVMNGDYYTPLNIAVENGQEDIVKQLLDAGANPNLGYIPPLHKASTVAIMKILLEHGADIHMQRSGNTVLASAVSANNIEVSRYLLERGISPNTSNVGKKTPLGYAMDKKNQAMIDLLKQYGATDGGVK